MLILCVACQTNAQQLLSIRGNSKPKLHLKAVILESVYCSSSNLRLHLRLTFQNTGAVPLLLRKEGFHIGEYLVSRDRGGGRKGKREIEASLEVSGFWIMDNMLQDRTFNESPFVRLAPQASHSIPTDIHLNSIDDIDDPDSLRPGNYLLEVLVNTWFDTRSTATRLQNQYKTEGYLWTKSVMSEPIPFTIAAQKVIKGCN
jgi:hypothetical protein